MPHRTWSLGLAPALTCLSLMAAPEAVFPAESFSWLLCVFHFPFPLSLHLLCRFIKRRRRKYARCQIHCGSLATCEISTDITWAEINDELGAGHGCSV